MGEILYCASCGRSSTFGENGTQAIEVQGTPWCAHCAAIGELSDGSLYVEAPTPGRMYAEPADDSLNAWMDCYEQVPKKRILKRVARAEIQRAWDLWAGDKSQNEAMFIFFGWLNRHRPYFLTFRDKGDRWQQVHSWLLQHESRKS